MLKDSEANNELTGHAAATKPRSGLFRSLSETRKPRSWRPPTNAPTMTRGDNVHSTSIRSQAVNASQNAITLSKRSPAPPSSYQILPEWDSSSTMYHYQRARDRDGRSTPAPSANVARARSASESTSSLPGTSALATPQRSHPEMPCSAGLEASSLADDTFQLTQRRKASMSKLMRHFGETRIPPEFLLPSGPDTSPSREEVFKVSHRPKKVRTRSLDVKNFTGPSSLSDPKTQPSTLTRSKSLSGRRSLATKRSLGNLSAQGDAETTQWRVRRARKVAQILGPEISPALPQITGTFDAPATPVIITPPPQQGAFAQSNLLTKLSIDCRGAAPIVKSTIGSLQVDTPPDPATPITPLTPAPLSEAAEHRKRTEKLAKFFGVSQNDISVPRAMSKTSNPTSVRSRPPPLQDVEVNIQVTGRRFWGLTPERTKFRSVQTCDAVVIDQLRTLKSG